jgi:hypothetical protein
MVILAMDDNAMDDNGTERVPVADASDCRFANSLRRTAVA